MRPQDRLAIVLLYWGGFALAAGASPNVQISPLYGIPFVVLSAFGSALLLVPEVEV